MLAMIETLVAASLCLHINAWFT